MKAKAKRKVKRTKLNSGLYWHLHHMEGCEFCYNAQARRDYITTDKSAYEHELRLKLFKPVTTKGASKTMAKMIVELRSVGAQASKGYRETITRKYGYSDVQEAAKAVFRALHKKQCHPRCPQHGWDWFGNILEYQNNNGEFVLKPSKKK